MGETEWDIIISNPPYISPRGYVRETHRSVRNWEPKLALVPCSSSYSCTLDGDISKSSSSSLSSSSPSSSSSSSAMSASYQTDSGLNQDVAIADLFYPRLFSIANQVNAKVVLVEAGDLAQAGRVARLAHHYCLPEHTIDLDMDMGMGMNMMGTGKAMTKWGKGGVEIWRDWLVPSSLSSSSSPLTSSSLSSSSSSSSPTEDIKILQNNVVQAKEPKFHHGNENENVKMKVKVLGQGNGRCVLTWRDSGGEWLGR